MTKLRPQILTVSNDDCAVRLFETVRRVLNEQGHSEDRRFQHIWVCRDGAFSEYVEDLGPAADFPGEQFVLLADFEPVGRLRDMAAKRRTARPLRETWGIEPVDFRLAAERQLEERWKRQHKISVFGSHFFKQRSS